VVAVPIAVGAVRLVLALDRTFTSGGDVAFIELAVRQVLHGGTALGPYSRFGWHHPGPALFYLFAPGYWLSGESSRSLFLGAWLLNGTCLLGAVWIVRRRVGETVARLAAVLICLYIGVVGFGSLINPWNPSLLAAPLLLLLVAAAAAAAGSTWSLVAVGVTASYLVQTHLGTVPVVAVVSLVAVVGWTWGIVAARRQARTTTRRHRRELRAASGRMVVPLAVGVALVALAWVGPVVQEITQPQGNLTRIAEFYRDPPASVTPHSHGVEDAAAAVTDFVTTVPAGNPVDLEGHRDRFLLGAGIGLLGVVVGIAGWRRHRFLAWLGILSAAALPVSVLAGTRVIGPLYPYLFEPTRGLGIPAAIGAAGLVWTALARRVHDRRSPVSARGRDVAAVLGVAAMVVVAVLVTRTVIRPQTVSYIDSPDSRAVAARIEALVDHDRTRVFQLRIPEQQFADGAVLLTLTKDGYRYRLAPAMDLYRGTSTGDGGPVFELRPSTTKARVPRDTTSVDIGEVNLRMRAVPTSG